MASRLPDELDDSPDPASCVAVIVEAANAAIDRLAYQIDQWPDSVKARVVELICG